MANNGSVVSMLFVDAGDTICSISHLWQSLTVGSGVVGAGVIGATDVSLQVWFVAGETMTGAVVAGALEVPLLTGHSVVLGDTGATEVELLSAHSVGLGVAGATEVPLLSAHSVGLGVGIAGATQSCFGHSKLTISESLYSHPRIPEASLMLNR